MSQEYTPVEWVDETPTTQGTTINKQRLDQMQSAHHYADGFEEVDSIPTEDPGVGYHKIVYCTADRTIYRWDGSEWTKDIDDATKALLDAHIADRSNPHGVTAAQVGLGSVADHPQDDAPTQNSDNYVKSGGVFSAVASKQDALVSGVNIKTVGGVSLLGSGDIQVGGAPEAVAPIYIDQDGKIALEGWTQDTGSDWRYLLSNGVTTKDILINPSADDFHYIPKGTSGNTYLLFFPWGSQTATNTYASIGGMRYQYQLSDILSSTLNLPTSGAKKYQYGINKSDNADATIDMTIADSASSVNKTSVFKLYWRD